MRKSTHRKGTQSIRTMSVSYTHLDVYKRQGLCDASEYDEKYKKWSYEDLPIVPECWKHKILEGTKKQFGILKKLMRDSKVDEVICADVYKRQV